jgi:hypothetical protein
MAHVIHTTAHVTGKQRRLLHQQVRLLDSRGLLTTNIADADAFIRQEIELSETPRKWASDRISHWEGMLGASEPKPKPKRKPRRKFADPTK